MKVKFYFHCYVHRQSNFMYENIYLFTPVKNFKILVISSLPTGYFESQKNEPRIGQYWRYVNMTIVITDKALDGSYEEEAKNLRDHGIIVHAVGWGDVSHL